MSNLRLETITDALLSQANYNNIEIIVDYPFGDDNKTIIVQNCETGKFGIVATNVREYPNDEICFFEFNDRMYKYCKAEGFERQEMMKSFDKNILVKVDKKGFFNYIFRKQ